MLTTRRVLGVASALMMAAWFLLLRPAFLGGPASYIMVSGISMEPTLYTGDLAVLLSSDSYQVGEVVAFRAQNSNVIHRIVGGSAAEGFVMQGDNKNAPDLWRPTPDQVLGKMWLHLPGVGRIFAYLRQPAPMAALAGALTLLSLWGGGKVRRRWRRGRLVKVKSSQSGGQLPGPTWMVAALAVSALVAVALGTLAVLAFRQPVERFEEVERLRYEHTAAFDYTVRMQPSILYPEGLLGPVAAPRDPATKTSSPPIYTKLARGLDLGFAYNLGSSLPPQVSGELSETLEIMAGENGWSSNLELLPPTPFAGSSASARVTVDFAQIWSLIDSIEKETGFKPAGYDVVVVPTVHIKGGVGAETIDESYAPRFTMKLSRTQITLDDQLARDEVKKVGDTVNRVQQIGLGGLGLSVATARWVGAAGAALFLAIAALLAAFVFLGLGRNETAKIRARYGSMLISVAQADLKENTQVVEVASIDDLARLAQRDGQIIFHQQQAPASHLYFIHHGDVVYSFKPGEPREGS